ncbi:MAG: hypothetical protein INR64_07635 [Caulobacteraceae bacterium]|nr:hypothetical protein [Caulobacter sp.]
MAPPPALRPVRRGFAGLVRLYLLLAATLVALVLVLRVIAPALVSAHSDVALALAALLLLACPVALLWVAREAVRIWRAPGPAAS